VSEVRCAALPSYDDPTKLNTLILDQICRGLKALNCPGGLISIAYNKIVKNTSRKSCRKRYMVHDKICPQLKIASTHNDDFSIEQSLSNQ
jgi:hypothetical protein